MSFFTTQTRNRQNKKMTSKGKYCGIPAGFEDDDDNSLDGLLCSSQNLKITVVPDITTGAGLNGEDFDKALSPEMDNWFEDFKETFGKCKPRHEKPKRDKISLKMSM